MFEDTYNIAELKKRGLAESIREEELREVDVSKFGV